MLANLEIIQRHTLLLLTAREDMYSDDSQCIVNDRITELIEAWRTEVVVT